jgi:hypothetical protein
MSIDDAAAYRGEALGGAADAGVEHPMAEQPLGETEPGGRVSEEQPTAVEQMGVATDPDAGGAQSGEEGP